MSWPTVCAIEDHEELLNVGEQECYAGSNLLSHENIIGNLKDVALATIWTCLLAREDMCLTRTMAIGAEQYAEA